MIWTADVMGQVTYICPEWYAFTGQEASAALGQGWTEAVHPDERELMNSTFLAACQLQCEFVLQYRLRRNDGAYVWVIGSAAPSRLPSQGTFLGFLDMVRPVEAPQIGLIARAELETFQAAVAAGEFAPASKLDLVADHLLMARAAALGAADELLPAIEDLLFEVGCLLARGLEQKDVSTNIH
jgi:PAS domain S-box-containing protein